MKEKKKVEESRQEAKEKESKILSTPTKI